MRVVILILLLINSRLCAAADWHTEINLKLDSLGVQLNDGCSSEVRKARTLYKFKAADDQLFVALFSIEGYHCGNGNTEYLAIYKLGHERPKDENDTPPETYWLAALSIVGGRGHRFTNFESLKYSGDVFTLDALAYKDDPI